MRNENRYVFQPEDLPMLRNVLLDAGLTIIQRSNPVTQTIYFDHAKSIAELVYLRARGYITSFSDDTLTVRPDFDYQFQYKLERQTKASMGIEYWRLAAALSGVGLVSVGLFGQIQITPTGATEWLRQHFSSNDNEEQRVTLDIARRYYVFGETHKGELVRNDDLIRVECKEPSGELRLSEMIKRIPGSALDTNYTEQILKRK